MKNFLYFANYLLSDCVKLDWDLKWPWLHFSCFYCFCFVCSSYSRFSVVVFFFVGFVWILSEKKKKENKPWKQFCRLFEEFCFCIFPAELAPSELCIYSPLFPKDVAIYTNALSDTCAPPPHLFLYAEYGCPVVAVLHTLPGSFWEGSLQLMSSVEAQDILKTQDGTILYWPHIRQCPFSPFRSWNDLLLSSISSFFFFFLVEVRRTGYPKFTFLRLANS